MCNESEGKGRVAKEIRETDASHVDWEITISEWTRKRETEKERERNFHPGVWKDSDSRQETPGGPIEFLLQNSGVEMWNYRNLLDLPKMYLLKFNKN